MILSVYFSVCFADILLSRYNNVEALTFPSFWSQDTILNQLQCPGVLSKVFLVDEQTGMFGCSVAFLYSYFCL